MQTIDSLADNLRGYLNKEQVKQVCRAYYYAEQAHDGQIRRSGEPYVTHPLAVAFVLAEMQMDHQSLVAALLHDVIEDTGIEKHAIEQQFSSVVAELVDGVSKLTQISFSSKAEAQAENFQKMTLAMARDIRVIVVKLADRLHNMRTLGVLRPDKRRRIAHETLEIYAPIAQRLGMNTIRVEFEELGFAALHPMRSRRIQSAVKAARGNRREVVAKISDALEAKLKDASIEASVVGREKHLYSIYNKMRQKKKSFADIMDVFAFRIIVDSTDTCYRALGAVHSLYKPVTSQFKDYIAIPKNNGYQSLHSVLIGLHGMPIEVQIRTQEMEEMANNGIAAHWLYKASTEHEAESHSSHQRARQWVQSLLEMKERSGDSMEFIENVKIDLFPDEVYLFTPSGEIKELPASATAIDFAYAVHSDVGNRCVACRINRKLAPLSEPLQNGQTVEIITSPTGKPQLAWLNFVTTGKARTSIRHYLKHQQQTESVSLGKQLLDKALKDLGASVDKLNQTQLEFLLEQTGCKSVEEVLEDIGKGNRVAFLTARRLLSKIELDDSKHGNKTMAISGTEGVMMSFAQCCYPIPGDAILGHVSAGKGIIVHRDSCNHLSTIRKRPEQYIPLSWADDVSGEFSVAIRISMVNRRGIFMELANKINLIDGDIENIVTEKQDATHTDVVLTLGLVDRVHLAKIMRRARSINGVYRVERTKSSPLTKRIKPSDS
ncbi:MAG: guanosine-3',5'-bis(diphosphate) 3'-pyrophosphohydrolase [Pseudomonadales bacterium]|jgi:guanosine-3',5'-bis(diphosphate) 3'-pyrophosphohydrolase